MTRAKSIRIACLALAALALLVASGVPPRAVAQAPDYGGVGIPEPDQGEPAFKEHRHDSKKDNPAPCPLLGVLYDASRLVQLVKPEEVFANVGFTGEINGIHGLCSYSGAKPIAMNLTIDMAFGRGPGAASESHVYRYWVAVTRTNVAPLAKQYFDVPVKFEKNETRVFHAETIKKIVIPRANANVAGPAFEILVGFDLTPDELAFNRAGKRFKMSAQNPG